MKKNESIEKDVEQTISLTDISKGSFLYLLAEASINENGFYTCMYKEKKTLIHK